jgi:hypothetical protein
MKGDAQGTIALGPVHNIHGDRLARALDSFHYIFETHGTNMVVSRLIEKVQEQ